MRPRRVTTIRNIRSRAASRGRAEHNSAHSRESGKPGPRTGSPRSRRRAGSGNKLMQNTASTVDETEVARFSAMAEEWWDPRGKMAVLHKFNPIRLGYIRDAACKTFERNPKQLDCLN